MATNWANIVRCDVVRLPEVIIGPHRLPQVVAELSLAKAGLFGSEGGPDRVEQLMAIIGMTGDPAVDHAANVAGRNSAVPVLAYDARD